MSVVGCGWVEFGAVRSGKVRAHVSALDGGKMPRHVPRKVGQIILDLVENMQKLDERVTLSERARNVLPMDQQQELAELRVEIAEQMET